MARRRHRRHYRGITSVNLGALPGLDMLDKSANGMDVLIGAAVGFVGGQVVSGLAMKYLPESVTSMLVGSDGKPSIISKILPLVVSGAAGAILYYAQKKSSRGYGHLVGSLAVGAAFTVREFLKDQTIAGITFSEVVGVNLGGYSGLLVADNTGMNGFAGLLVDDNTGTKASLNQLGALSMGGDDDGLYSLMSN